MSNQLISTIGLCAKAGGLVIGTPMVCETMQKKANILAVLEASDTSANTHEKLQNKCAYYHIPLYRINATTAELGKCIGKSGVVAAVGVTHSGLMTAIAKHLCPSDTTES